MNTPEMREKIASGHGFIAALDQSGGSTPKTLRAYGFKEDAWSSDGEMFDLVHAMRARIITSPAFTGEKVIGAILFEQTMTREAEGLPVPQALHNRGVVPFLKIDVGLQEERDGVQLMKPVPDLEARLDRAAKLGVFGTKERSVVNLAHRAGIAAVVNQQFEVARRVLSAGLVPIIEPEVNIKSHQRADADAMLQEEIRRALDDLPREEQVILKLSLPAEAGLFQPLIDHARVLRVVALSGGFSRAEACAELAKNPGIIASFSRALIEDLHHGMSAEVFDRALGYAINEIHQASTQSG